jgi:hypothetical protein
VVALSPARYIHRMRGIEARRNAALRDSDCACLRAAAQQEAVLNHLFWIDWDLARHVQSPLSHGLEHESAVIVINDGGLR